MLGYLQRIAPNGAKFQFKEFYKGSSYWCYDYGTAGPPPTLFVKDSDAYNKALSQIGTEMLRYPYFYKKIIFKEWKEPKLSMYF